jgi:hypothetical protein
MNDIFKSGNDGKAVARPGASNSRESNVFRREIWNEET